MGMDIAVYIGEDGQTASIYDKGTIAVWRRNRGCWEIIREKFFAPDRQKGIGELRKNLEEIVDFLGDCTIFAALSVTGIPYYELEKAGCRVWEFEGQPPDFLDYILVREEEAELETSRMETADETIAPVQIGSGQYFISLKEIQQKNAGITSKRALLPFLRNEVFYSLEIICSHVPPWLEAEMLASGMEGKTDRIGMNEIKVTITKQCCS